MRAPIQKALPNQPITGRFRTTRLLGKGAFGQTWAGIDEATGEPVAIKVVDLRDVQDWKSVELFQREAQVLASLDHPRIPRYVGFVPVRAESRGYLVQGLAPGKDLEQRLLAGERFSEGQVRSIAAQVLDILQYLAGRRPQVVHRDVKPSNLILDDHGEVVRLVDFGSVQAAGRAADPTGGSTVAGTFGYMAPEQLHGGATVRSDLYGLGMTVIHLLTGAPPDELPRQRLRPDFRAALPGLSEPLARWLDRMIEPIPDDRFAGPAQALHALQAPTSAPAARQAVQAKAARLLALDRRRRAAIERRNSSGARAELVAGPEGIRLTIKPRSLWAALAGQLPLSGFLALNPGFVVVGGFPFFGRFWPVLSGWWPGRVAVWLVVLAGLNLLLAWWRSPPLHVEVSPQGHFVLYRRDPASPVGAGDASSLRLHLAPPGDDGLGEATLHGDEVALMIPALSEADLEVLASFDSSLQALRRSE